MIADSRPPHPAGSDADIRNTYKWIALSNTTLAMFMSALDGSIVIISLPAIFRGIHLDPLAPGNTSYLLWMIMGYLLVQAVLVVTVGRLGDLFGRVRMYNSGFVVFTIASLLLSFDPFVSGAGALWLIGWRFFQALGGSTLTANSAAILTDAFPATQRGLALGINQVSGLAGQFIGLVAGGILAAYDWRAIFWVNVPVGIFGTIWAYTKLKETSERSTGRIDWWGNITFAAGLGTLLIAITTGIQPYGQHAMSWTNPVIIAALTAGLVLLALFCVIEQRTDQPMFQFRLFRIPAFAAGAAARLAAAVAQGGLQFMLVIWLQGIWLPVHGVAYDDTPLRAGICMLPITAGYLIAGPLSGILSDRFGSRLLAGGGSLLFACALLGLTFLPVNFSYAVFALLIALCGVGVGMFSAPNTSSMMGSVPVDQRGSASGMRATFQNSGSLLSIGVFFSLMITGLAVTLPTALATGLQQQGVSAEVAQRIGALPPVSSLFSAFLGENPMRHLLTANGVLASLPLKNQQLLTGGNFFPNLIAAPFHHGLRLALSAAACLSFFAAAASFWPTTSNEPTSPNSQR